MSGYSACNECGDYIERRKPVLLPEVRKQAERNGEFWTATLHRYMTGVHDRHMSGLSLSVTS
jgi:hypothetical protein